MASNSWSFKKSLPNMCTMANGICGLTAVMVAIAGLTGELSAATSFGVSIGLVVLAMFFDAIDGKVARMTGSTSKIGAQLDSLCDGISFGAVPALLMYIICVPHVSWIPAWVAAMVYMCCAIFRLARFNVETPDDSEESHSWFSGLPSPAAAATVCGTALLLRLISTTTLVAALVLVAITIAAGILMVSRIRVPHLNMVVKLIKGRA